MQYGHKAKTPLNKKNQKIEKRNNKKKILYDSTKGY